MLEKLTRALSGAPAEVRGALAQAFHLALLALVVPGLVLGGLYTLTRPAPLPLAALLGLLGVAVVVGGAALHLARQSARDPRLPPKQAALTAAIQLASVPAVPLLLGCTALRQFAALAALWGLAVIFYMLARTQLAGLEKSAPPNPEAPQTTAE